MNTQRLRHLAKLRMAQSELFGVRFPISYYAALKLRRIGVQIAAEWKRCGLVFDPFEGLSARATNCIKEYVSLGADAREEVRKIELFSIPQMTKDQFNHCSAGKHYISVRPPEGIRNLGWKTYLEIGRWLRTVPSPVGAGRDSGTPRKFKSTPPAHPETPPS